MSYFTSNNGNKYSKYEKILIFMKAILINPANTLK